MGAVVRHGQKAGDIVEHPVGVAEEDVDDLGDEPLVLWRLQLLVVLVQNSLDPSGQVRRQPYSHPGHEFQPQGHTVARYRVEGRDDSPWHTCS